MDREAGGCENDGIDVYSWFISTISLGLMNGGYIYSFYGIYKPTNITGGHHLVVYLPCSIGVAWFFGCKIPNPDQST